MSDRERWIKYAKHLGYRIWPDDTGVSGDSWYPPGWYIETPNEQQRCIATLERAATENEAWNYFLNHFTGNLMPPYPPVDWQPDNEDGQL